jgi:hypothetical protein
MNQKLFSERMRVTPQVFERIKGELEGRGDLIETPGPSRKRIFIGIDEDSGFVRNIRLSPLLVLTIAGDESLGKKIWYLLLSNRLDQGQLIIRDLLLERYPERAHRASGDEYFATLEPQPDLDSMLLRARALAGQLNTVFTSPESIEIGLICADARQVLTTVKNSLARIPDTNRFMGEVAPTLKLIVEDYDQIARTTERQIVEDIEREVDPVIKYLANMTHK